MIEYSLPDFTIGLNRNLFFIKLADSNPELFMPDVHIDSVYGCFPGCTLNGGRACVREPYSKSQMEDVFTQLAEFGVRPRLTFTNMIADETTLDDYARDMLDVAQRFNGEIIVYDGPVNDFMEANTSMNRTLSTTFPLEDPRALNTVSPRYDHVVLNYNFGKDDSFLDAVNQPEKLEVMVNELCTPMCPYRQQHYLHNSIDQANCTITHFRDCDYTIQNFYEHRQDNPTVLTNEDVRHLNRKYGIELFKVVGRGVLDDLSLEAYLYYLVRPEFREPIRHLIRSAHRSVSETV